MVLQQTSSLLAKLCHLWLMESTRARSRKEAVMTANQINRFRAETDRRVLEETRKHNRASEYLQARDISSNEIYRDRQGRAALTQAGAAQTSASAAVQSAIAAQMQATTAAARQIEDARHNAASEQISQQQADTRSQEVENARKLGIAQLGQQVVHQGATRLETSRHNRVEEGIRQQQADSSTSQAEAAKQQAAAATTRAESEARRVGSQNIRDYANAFRSVTGGLGDLTGTAKGILEVLK